MKEKVGIDVAKVGATGTLWGLDPGTVPAKANGRGYRLSGGSAAVEARWSVP